MRGSYALVASPVVVRPPTNTDLEPGEGASIDCAVSGLPNPRIEWFVTDELGERRHLNMTVGEHYVIHTDGLELVGLTQQESGVYECRAENDLGTDTRSARIRVEGQSTPFEPHSPTNQLLYIFFPRSTTCSIILPDNHHCRRQLHPDL